MIKIICVGKIKEKYIKDGINDYLKRIKKYHKIEIIELIDNNKIDEANNIKKHINSRDYIITLEINGNRLNSFDFAKKIDNLFTINSNIVFIIGGSDGLDDSISNLSNYKLSFSNFTFPHQLFRLIFFEQLYRCFKILNNETYHK